MKRRIQVQEKAKCTHCLKKAGECCVRMADPDAEANHKRPIRGVPAIADRQSPANSPES
jgi:hypothetical protein